MRDGWAFTQPQVVQGTRVLYGYISAESTRYQKNGININGALLRLLLPEGVVPWLVWALRGTTPLNAILWAVENESLSANTLLERCLASKTQNNKE